MTKKENEKIKKTKLCTRINPFSAVVPEFNDSWTERVEGMCAPAENSYGILAFFSRMQALFARVSTYLQTSWYQFIYRFSKDLEWSHEPYVRSTGASTDDDYLKIHSIWMVCALFFSQIVQEGIIVLP